MLFRSDSRGFGWGAVLEWYHQDWAVRGGRMNTPQTPNGLAMDFALARHFGDQIEIEHAHQWRGQPGKVRVLAYNNRAVMADFDQASAYLAQQGYPTLTGPTPLIAVRGAVRTKQGIGLNLEQALARVKRQVNPEHYALYHLHVIQGLSPAETGRTLGVSLASVYLAKLRVGRRLREELRRLVGGMPQLAGIRLGELADGRVRGVRAAEVFTGSGLQIGRAHV